MERRARRAPLLSHKKGGRKDFTQTPSGAVRMSGAPGPSCTSERVSQEVAMKARKLLAKVRGGIVTLSDSAA